MPFLSVNSSKIYATTRGPAASPGEEKVILDFKSKNNDQIVRVKKQSPVPPIRNYDNVFNVKFKDKNAHYSNMTPVHSRANLKNVDTVERRKSKGGSTNYDLLLSAEI